MLVKLFSLSQLSFLRSVDMLTFQSSQEIIMDSNKTPSPASVLKSDIDGDFADVSTSSPDRDILHRRGRRLCHD